ncbi:MAG TPA: hydrogenase maturation peptidase HycI [Anaerolineales bacterium]|nr:hydrogenase maturation peptidase HycI [Anaerolineales bacterium]
MISPKSWQISLNRLMSQTGINSGGRPRIAIIGIGNELRADDAAGMLVVSRLLKYGSDFDQALIRVIQAGLAPENSTSELRAFAPHLVLFVDAADMGEVAGTIRWIDMEEISGISASTHSLPLSILAAYLIQEIDCQVALLGIQPASNDVGGPVSLEVLQAVEEIVNELGTRFSSGEDAAMSLDTFRG